MDRPLTHRPAPSRMKYLSLSTWLILLVVIFNQATPVQSQDCTNTDIALVVDTSDSVQPVWEGTTGVKRFIQVFINQFNIGLDRVRISSQTFGSRARVNWILRRYADKNSMITAADIDQEFIGGRTFYDLAFREVLAAQFTETSGDRPQSPNKVVLVTDGTESLESRFAVLQEAERLRNSGAMVYVIGYGPNVNREYMIQIAGDRSRVYIADSVPRLIETVNQAVATVCPQTLPPSPVPTPSPQTPDCSFADVALIVDSSSSVTPVWSINGGIQDLLRQIVNNFNIGPNAVRLSTQVFADRAFVNWDLDDGISKTTILRLIGPLMYFRGEPFTFYDQGLDAAREQQFSLSTGDRPNAPNIAILITDGTTSTENRFATNRAASLLRNVATVYAIGWGSADPVELATITGDSRRVYYTPDYRQLTSATNFPNVFSIICPQILPTRFPTFPTPRPTFAPIPQPSGRCDVVDIAMLVDTSTSVMRVWSGTRGIQDFLRQFINRVDIGENEVRMSVQTFADAAFVNWNFDVYYNSAPMIDQVQSIYFRRSDQTLYDVAFNFALSDQFVTSLGDRPNVRNIAILVTDGSTSYNRNEVLAAATNLRNRGVDLYIVGWGAVDSNAMLELVGGDSRKLYTTTEYSDLVLNLDQILNMVCPLTSAPVPPPVPTPGPVPTPFPPFPTVTPNPQIAPVCSEQADIALIIDTSGSINEETENWPTVVEFLVRLVSQLDIGPNMIRVGAVQFSDNEFLEWTLDGITDRQAMIDRIRQILYFGGRTNLAGGLELARTGIFTTQGDRPDAPNVALVITDGIPNEREDETIPQADLLKQVVEEVVVVTVGVTNPNASRLLEDVSTGQDNIIRLQDFDALTTDLNRIVNQVCVTLPPPTAPSSGLKIIMLIISCIQSQVFLILYILRCIVFQYLNSTLNSLFFLCSTLAFQTAFLNFCLFQFELQCFRKVS